MRVVRPTLGESTLRTFPAATWTTRWQFLSNKPREEAHINRSAPARRHGLHLIRRVRPRLRQARTPEPPRSPRRRVGRLQVLVLLRPDQVPRGESRGGLVPRGERRGDGRRPQEEGPRPRRRRHRGDRGRDRHRRPPPRGRRGRRVLRRGRRAPGGCVLQGRQARRRRQRQGRLWTKRAERLGSNRRPGRHARRRAHRRPHQVRRRAQEALHGG